jgi:hypothetical protein
MRLPDVSISGLELSDLFFNYPRIDGDNLEVSAGEFLNELPSLKAQGITVKQLVEDYQARL